MPKNILQDKDYRIEEQDDGEDPNKLPPHNAFLETLRNFLKNFITDAAGEKGR